MYYVHPVPAGMCAAMGTAPAQAEWASKAAQKSVYAWRSSSACSHYHLFLHDSWLSGGQDLLSDHVGRGTCSFALVVYQHIQTSGCLSYKQHLLRLVPNLAECI